MHIGKHAPAGLALLLAIKGQMVGGGGQRNRGFQFTSGQPAVQNGQKREGWQVFWICRPGGWEKGGGVQVGAPFLLSSFYCCLSGRPAAGNAGGARARVCAGAKTGMQRRLFITKNGCTRYLNLQHTNALKERRGFGSRRVGEAGAGALGQLRKEVEEGRGKQKRVCWVGRRP